MSWIVDSGLNFFQKFCVNVIKAGGAPNHVAFIMDGNRRFAKKKNVESIQGHTKGFDKLAETLQWCLELGIPEVTVYALSIDNILYRNKEETDALFELAKEKFQRLLDERDKLMENGICVRVIGNMKYVPKDLAKLAAEATLVTKDNKKAVLNVAFSYTGQEEILHVIQEFMEGCARNILQPSDVDEHLIEASLYTNKSYPVDLLIRTSGEVRFSNFLLWQVSTSCIYFTKVLWPDFTFWHLLAAIFYYQRSRSHLADFHSFEKEQHLFEDNQRKQAFLEHLENKRQTILEAFIDLRGPQWGNDRYCFTLREKYT